ncbi:ImmA/IrrE family metallo-endopeptidase [Bacillus sp. B-jedd]|uniref:ImmA/IrrE family metallo-endopeptidase n=1 Tax=Bacillus sp. B-jedd TaxID=1476857 RepID=UPI0005156B2A|nr:ImmA/IrrE family metallo-endopeptidase [Bacillus sp. B-jedd]CEG28121.1 putative immunity region protein 2 [Bacillus sp. B-jedd]
MGSIKKKVHFLVKKYGTNCPFKIAQHLGILVHFENLGNTLGYYSKQFRIQIIHINETVENRKQEYICSHELGHAILHPEANTPFLKKNTFFSTDQIEIEANTFAIELLFSNDSMDGVTINEAIEDYGIPKQLALLKSY